MSRFGPAHSPALVTPASRAGGEYEVEIRIRNGRFLRQMRMAGYPTIAAFARAIEIKQSDICRISALKVSALAKDGTIRKTVDRIATFLRCMPEDLFPPAHFRDPMDRNRAVITASLDELQSFTAQFREDASLPDERMAREQGKSIVRRLLETLTPREERVIRFRFGIDLDRDATLATIAADYGLTGARIREIEAKALRKLRGKRRHKMAAAAFDAIIGSEPHGLSIEDARAARREAEKEAWVRARQSAAPVRNCADGQQCLGLCPETRCARVEAVRARLLAMRTTP